MRIYLDNNIFVYLEQKKIEISDLEDLVVGKFSKIFFSPAHVQETLEIKGQTDNQRNDWINQRLNLISQITRNYYLHEGLDNIISEYVESPFEVYKTITEVSFAQDSMKDLANLVDEESREESRKALGIESRKISNFGPEDLINELDKVFAALGMNSFQNFLETSIKFHPDYKKFGLSNRIAALFETLDILGYCKDKFNEKSNYARQWDSNHCSFASACDVFISNDKKMINKAKVAFQVYKVETKIIYSNI